MNESAFRFYNAMLCMLVILQQNIAVLCYAMICYATLWFTFKIVGEKLPIPEALDTPTTSAVGAVCWYGPASVSKLSHFVGYRVALWGSVLEKTTRCALPAHRALPPLPVKALASKSALCALLAFLERPALCCLLAFI